MVLGLFLALVLRPAQLERMTQLEPLDAQLGHFVILVLVLVVTVSATQLARVVQRLGMDTQWGPERSNKAKVE